MSRSERPRIVPRLYDHILRIARNYMGAAAEDYIRRRIRIVQRGQDPETIEHDRLARLAAGIEMTASGYMSESKAEAFCREIIELEAKHESATETSESRAEPKPSSTLSKAPS